MRVHQTLKQQQPQQLTECSNLPSTRPKKKKKSQSLSQSITVWLWSIRCSWRMTEMKKDGKKLAGDTLGIGKLKAKVWKLCSWNRSCKFWMMGFPLQRRASLSFSVFFPSCGNHFVNKQTKTASKWQMSQLLARLITTLWTSRDICPYLNLTNIKWDHKLKNKTCICNDGQNRSTEVALWAPDSDTSLFHSLDLSPHKTGLCCLKPKNQRRSRRRDPLHHHLPSPTHQPYKFASVWLSRRSVFMGKQISMAWEVSLTQAVEVTTVHRHRPSEHQPVVVSAV